MAKYVAKWGIQGIGKKPIEPGETFEAKPEEVKNLLSVRHGGSVELHEHASVLPSESAVVIAGEDAAIIETAESKREKKPQA